MKRGRMPLLAAALWACLCAVTGAGCVSGEGFAQALADDLAFTASAATQGFLRGWFERTAP
jgi:hypothetical protein